MNSPVELLEWAFCSLSLTFGGRTPLDRAEFMPCSLKLWDYFNNQTLIDTLPEICPRLVLIALWSSLMFVLICPLTRSWAFQDTVYLYLDVMT